MAYYDPHLRSQDVIDRLLGLDRELLAISIKEGFSIHSRIRIIIAGSSVLMLHGITRTMISDDIDLIRLSANIGPDLLSKYDMNTRIITYENSLPYHYMDRIVKVDLPTKVIDYYALSLEDAVAGKIYAWRGKDVDHLHDPEVIERIDWSKLKESICDLYYSLLNTWDFPWICHRFNLYLEEVGHEELKFENI
ncbi:MAG: hypothetical protein IKG46_11995 [Solobacterium sp.]|nr:hypothetical protein [Solobacterium sp.]